MKKVILVSLISTMVSGGAFAATGQTTAPVDGDSDTTSATLRWTAEVPVIVPGAWVTLTGESGSMTLKDGNLNLKADGTFDSEGITLELHTYDEVAGTSGALVKLGTDQFNGVGVNSVSYSVSQPTFESVKGTDVSNVTSTVKLDGSAVGTDTAVGAGETTTYWAVSGKGVGSMVGGDNVTATTVVRADVDFATITPAS